MIGISIAKALAQSFPDSAIKVLEAERRLGVHASGRNSGVLHAGFYYSTDSLKAKFCRLGCQAWTEFSLERNIPLLQCGKLVTARDESEVEYLYELYEQGQINGVKLELLSREDALKMEPTLNGVGEVIHSPTTCVMDIDVALQTLKDSLP